MLSPEILKALSEGKISEGHTRPLMMLIDRLAEQETLFKEIIFRRLTVREAEAAARNIAVDRARKKGRPPNDPLVADIEKNLGEALGTRVHIERREKGGKISIDFFSNEDLQTLVDLLNTRTMGEQRSVSAQADIPASSLDDRSKAEKDDDTDIYSLKNFTV